MDEQTERLYANPRADVWAEEFMRNFGERKDDIDEGLMIAWFANAMETAKGYALADLQRKADRLAIALVLTQEYLGSDVLPPIEGWSWYDALTDYYGEGFVPADRMPQPEPDPNEVAVTNGP